MSELAIEVHGLSKRYGDLEAVRGVDLEVATGEVFALLGPNGAGKTTTVEILEGHRARSGGMVSVLGFDPAANQRGYRERIGIVLQETGVQPYLTVAETIELFRGYYPHPRPVAEVLAVVGLTEQAARRVRQLSGGQRRRLDVAVGLCGDPDLLFLDEPTTGFDPAARHQAWGMVRSLQDLGKTVFLTTHYMDEADHLADRVAIIRRGEIVVVGRPGDLTSAERATTIRFRLPPTSPPLPPALAATAAPDGSVAIESEAPTETLYRLTAWAHAAAIELLDLSVARPTLEEVYLRIVNETAAAEAGG
jgi:ABC-2 type transport system ATP-binding protein